MFSRAAMGNFGVISGKYLYLKLLWYEVFLISTEMKPKLNKKLSLPWTPQRETASRNHQIL